METSKGQNNAENVYPLLPRTATDIAHHGNEWYEFTISGKRFVYHRQKNNSTDQADCESLIMTGHCNG